ncbi:unnamed protein product [Pichia kudriavzevii]
MGGTDSRRRDDGENRGWKADIGPGAGENGEKTTPNTTFRQCCCFGKVRGEVRGVTPTGGDKLRTWEWTSPEMSSTLPPLFLLHTSAVCLSAPPLPQPSTPQVGY